MVPKPKRKSPAITASIPPTISKTKGEPDRQSIGVNSRCYMWKQSEVLLKLRSRWCGSAACRDGESEHDAVQDAGNPAHHHDRHSARTRAVEDPEQIARKEHGVSVDGFGSGGQGFPDDAYDPRQCRH